MIISQRLDNVTSEVFSTLNDSVIFLFCLTQLVVSVVSKVPCIFVVQMC